jgi:acyl dehydratase
MEGDMADAARPPLRTGERLRGFTHVITRTDIVRYAGAGGDFNPLHHDDEVAHAAGFPSVFAMGLLPGGMLTRLWAGLMPDALVRCYRLRFTAPVFPGRPLDFGGTVKDITAERDGVMLKIELHVKSEQGDLLIAGNADIWLPTLDNGDATAIA